MRSNSSRSILLRLAFGSAIAGAASCATTQAARQVEESRTEIRMDPLVVRDKTDPLTGMDGYDAGQLLELGNRFYESHDYDRAAKVFDRLVSTFPDSELVASALYNAGLSYGELAEHALALERYQKIVLEHPDSTSFKDAYFRTSLSLAKLERWKDVADNFWAIRHLPKLTAMDELEARVGTGVGLFMQNDYPSAERELMSAVRFFEDKSKEEYLPADYFVGQTRFYLGEIAARQFEAIELKKPDPKQKGWEEMMGTRLEEKCELLIRAQNNFIRTIRSGHTGWATAAGYRIGSLYERLYDDLLGVPAPPGISEGATDFYREELKKRIAVLVTKAIKIYEQSLEMATRVGEKNEWVERTSKSLERMKSLYLESFSG